MSEYRGFVPRVQALPRVRSNRHETTDAERKLWNSLRRRQLDGAKFRRQHQFGPFELDFFCSDAKLVIEVDGGQQYTDEGARDDAERTRYLEANGLRVFRFTNIEVLTEIDAVLEAIRLSLWERELLV